MPRLGRALRDQLALGRLIGDDVPGLTAQRITERGEGRQVNGVAQRPALRPLQRWAGASVAGNATRRGTLDRVDGAVRGRGAMHHHQHRAVQLAGRPHHEKMLTDTYLYAAKRAGRNRTRSAVDAGALDMQEGHAGYLSP
jgi:hypothetical protein